MFMTLCSIYIQTPAMFHDLIRRVLSVLSPVLLWYASFSEVTLDKSVC